MEVGDAGEESAVFEIGSEFRRSAIDGGILGERAKRDRPFPRFPVRLIEEDEGRRAEFDAEFANVGVGHGQVRPGTREEPDDDLTLQERRE